MGWVQQVLAFEMMWLLYPNGLFPTEPPVKKMLVFLSLLTTILHLTNQLAQPKGFTDDPYVDDDKFIERGDMTLNTT